MSAFTRRFVVALVGLALVASTGAAQTSKCTGAKMKAAGKKAGAKTTCLAKGLSKGQSTDSTCLAKAEVKFSGAVAKTEAKAPTECLTTGDAGAIEAKVDTLHADIDALVGDAPNLSACDAAKVKAAGKKVNSKLTCHAKAVTKGLTVDSTCLAKAEVKFSGAAAKAETKAAAKDLACSATSDAADYESLVDAAVADIVTEITPTTTTTTGTTPTTTTTTPTGPTTTTNAPTTSTSTTTTSTTSTTLPAQVTCGSGTTGGLDVTASLVYEPRITGGVYGMYVLVNYPTSVSIPGSGTAASARARFTKLVSSQYGFVASDIDTNGNSVDDQGRTLVTASSQAPEIPPGPIERIRFDCAPGSMIQTSQFSCTIFQPSDSSGQLFAPAVAAQINCSLGSFTPVP